MKTQFHPILCKKNHYDFPWCDYCVNTASLTAACAEFDLQESLKLDSNSFEECVFLVPQTKLHWLHSIDPFKSEFSISIFHREFNTWTTLLKREYSDIISNSRSLSIHFIERDIEIIRNLNMNELSIRTDKKRLDYIFTPELGSRILAKKANKFEGMLAYASRLGQIAPICFLFPGFFRSDIQRLFEDLDELKPSAIGIYAGSSIISLLYENIEEIHRSFPGKPLYVVSICSPSKIKQTIEYGATNFVVSGWGRIGPKARMLDQETEEWINVSDGLSSPCSCCGCELLREIRSAPNPESTETLENRGLGRHNVIAFSNLVKKWLH